MPRKGDVVFVPVKGKTSAAPTFTLDQIPDEVKKEVEEIYEALKTAVGNMHVEYDTEAELIEYRRQVVAYCALRPEGPIRFRQSPVKNQPKNEMNFRITDLKTSNEEATDAVRDATEAVKEAAKDAEPAPASKRRR